MKDPAFLFYTKDFQSGTQDMSCEEVGAYIRLLMFQHQHGYIPNNIEKLMRITGIFLVSDWERVWSMVNHKFTVVGNHLVNQRMANETTVRSTSKPKKTAAATLAGLISANKLSFEQKSVVKKAFQINNFIEGTEEEIKLKVRLWFNQMVDQMVNNLADENANANGNGKVDERGNEGMGEKPKSSKQPSSDAVDYDEVMRIFNAVCPQLPEVKKMTDTRKAAVRGRAKEWGLESIGAVFQLTAESRFLNGETGRGEWKADFDWIMKPANFIKILEGNYRNSDGKEKSNSGTDAGYRVSDDLQRKITERLQSC
jgi:uncharacterized protein YdaU (DUF1376 family)